METHDRSREFRDGGTFSLLTRLEAVADQLLPWTLNEWNPWCINALSEADGSDEGICLPATVYYRHLLRHSLFIEIINVYGLKYELDAAFQVLPEGAKTEHYINRVNRIALKLSDINLNLLNVKPNVEYAQQQAHYQQAHAKALFQAFSEMEIDGLQLNPDASTLPPPDSVTPFVFEYKYIHTPLPDSVQRLLDKVSSVVQMLSSCIDVLSDFIRNTVPLIRSNQPNHSSGTSIDAGQVEEPRNSKKPPARAFADFTDKLQGGFIKDDLDALLVHVNFKNSKGETLQFKKYLMHQVIDELIEEGYFEKGTREFDQKALSRYLSLKETRVVDEGKGSKKSIRNKIKSYLTQFKNKQKNNG